MSTHAPLPIAQISVVPPRTDAQRWLVEGIWTRQAVGFTKNDPE